MTSSKVVRLLSLSGIAAVLAGASGACASRAPSQGSTGALQVDQTELVTGVGDTGRDPAIVALDVGAGSLCSGTLIAPDILLTARHCVSITTERVACPAHEKQITGERPPSSLRVLLGNDVATAKEVAHGIEVVVPAGDTLCDADIALVVLDRAVDVEPLDVSPASVTVGDHVSAIGFGRRADGDPPGTKLLREHVAILSTSSAEFLVGEATCQGDSGGPALDELTGEIVGVVSRGGPTCDGNGAHNVYTRTDVFLSLIDEALSRSAFESAAGAADGGTTTPDAGKKKRHKRDGGTKSKPPTDMGNACKTATDCATGICVTDPAKAKQYCSRSCAPHDRCPAHFRCTATGLPEKVCIESP